MAGRRAVHLRRRGLHLRLHHQEPAGRLHQLHDRHHQGGGRRRRHGQVHDGQAQGEHARDGRARSCPSTSGARSAPRRRGRRSRTSRRSSAPDRSRSWSSRRATSCAWPPTSSTGAARPRSTRSIFQYYTNADSMVQDLKSGAIDACWGVPEAQFKPLGQEPGLDGHRLRRQGLRRARLQLLRRAEPRQPRAQGLEVPPGAELRDRRAEAGLDRLQRLRRRRQHHHGPGLLQRPGLALDPAGRPRPTRYDPAKATAAARRRRLQDGDGGKRPSTKQGKPITLRLFACEAPPQGQKIGKLLTGWLEAIGIDIKYSYMTEGAMNEYLYNEKDGVFTPDMDLFVYNWTGDVDPDFILSLLHQGADRRLERLRLVDAGVRQALHAAVGDHRRGGAQDAHRPHAADRLRAEPLQRARVSQGARGREHLGVGGLGAVAERGRARRSTPSTTSTATSTCTPRPGRRRRRSGGSSSATVYVVVAIAVVVIAAIALVLLRRGRRQVEE